MIELAKLAPDAKTTGALVPRRWELVRRDPGGNVEVLARHVVSFDLSGDGDVVWSNGFEVYTLKAGERASLGRGELVESVAAL